MADQQGHDWVAVAVYELTRREARNLARATSSVLLNGGNLASVRVHCWRCALPYEAWQQLCSPPEPPSRLPRSQRQRAANGGGK